MADTGDLPTWADMSDLDKGCALLHDRAREDEGDDYAAEHYPARYLNDPRLTALTPAEATAHARKVCKVDNGDMFDRLGGDEYHRLYDLAANHGLPPAPAAPPAEAKPARQPNPLPRDVTAAIRHAITTGLPRPKTVGVPADGRPTLILHLHTPADVDQWAAMVRATVGHDDYTYRPDPDGPRTADNLVHEYGTGFAGGQDGRWIGRQVLLGCEVPGEAPRN